MKPLLIGQAPSERSDPDRPFSGRSGWFLERLIGLPRGGLSSKFDLVNLLDRWPGRSGKGDAFPAGVARQAAAKMDVLGRFVVLAGCKVAQAFGIVARALELVETNRSVFMVVPHPSGINRWWNDPGNRAKAADALRWASGIRSFDASTWFA